MIAELLDDALAGENWGAVDTLVRETVRRQARVRTMLPTGPSATNRYQVVIPTIDKKGMPHLDTSSTQAPLRISCKFKLLSEQIDDPSAISQLARYAAHRVAAAEDLILAFGSAAKGAAAVKNVTVKWDGKDTPGLSADGLAKAAPKASGADAVEAVQLGISKLQTGGHYGPYGVLMLGDLWESACVSSHKSDNQRRIENLLGDGGGMAPLSPADNGKRGVVFSLGAGAFDFIEVDAPAVSMVGYDDGDLILRVEERILLRVLDPDASENIALK